MPSKAFKLAEAMVSNPVMSDMVENPTATPTQIAQQSNQIAAVETKTSSISDTGVISVSAKNITTNNTLTQSFDSNQVVGFNLTDSINAVSPIVSVFKEVPQQGFSSKGQWDVNSNATNYEFYDEKPYSSYSSSTLTPSATGDGIFTNNNATVVGYQMSSTVNLNSTSPSITVQGNAGSWQVVEFDPTGNHVYMVSNTNQSGYAKTVYQYSMSTPHDLSTLNTTPANTLDMSSRVAGSVNHYCPLHITNSGYDLYFGDYQNNIIYQWKMSTAYDLSTASYHGASSAIFVNSMPSLFIQPNGLTGYQVQDGISGSAVLREFTMSTAWDITTASLSGTTSSTLISRTQAVTISPDGTLVIASDAFGSTTSKYFTMSPGYDLSSLSSGTSFTWQGNSSHTTDTRFSSNGALLYGWTGTYIYNYTTGSTAAFNAADVGKKVVGNSGSAIITGTSGTYKSVTAFADTSAISSWQLFGAEGKADGSGVSLSGYVSSFNISLSTLSYTWNTSAFSTTLRNMSFKPDGTRVIFDDPGSNNLHSVNLSTAWDLSTATLHHTKSVLSLNGGGYGIYFKPDGTTLWLTTGSVVYPHYLSSAWDISSTWTHYSGSHAKALGATVGSARDVHFSTDGTKMYVLDFTNRRVTEWDCSTAFRADTATYNNVLLDVYYNSSNLPMGMEFNSNGTVLLVISEQRNLLKYNLSTAWDLSTATYDSLKAVGSSGGASGLGIDTAGENFYVTIPNVSGDPVLQYYAAAANSTPYSQYMPALTNSSNGQINSSAWQDINSMTADETKNDGDVFYAVSTDNRTSWAVAKASDGVRKIVKNNSGTWQYNNDGGSSTTSPFSLSSPSYESEIKLDTGTGGWNSSWPAESVAFNNDGTKMYGIINAQNSGQNPAVYEFSLSTAYDVSTASYTTWINVQPNTGNRGLKSHVSLQFSPNGQYMYVNSASYDQLSVYTLSTAWDISTASHTRNVATTGFSTSRGGFVTSNGIIYHGASIVQDLTFQPINDYSLSSVGSAQTISGAFGSFNPETLVANADATKIFIHTGNTGSGSEGWVEYTRSSSNALSTSDTLTQTNVWNHGLSYDPKAGQFSPDGTKMIIATDVTGGKGARVFSTTGTILSYGTSETWVNGTNNNEHATLQEALGAQSINRMDKAQLDAVADNYHFSQDSADTLDLMIAPYAASGSSPISDGVTINYDAAALVREAVAGTDYVAEFPNSSTINIKSLVNANIKVRAL